MLPNATNATKVEYDMDIHENSLDNSADSELLGMVEEGSYGSAECDRSQLAPQSVLDSTDEDLSYNFKELSGGVTYKFVEMTGAEAANKMSVHHDIPSEEFFIIENPVQVFSTSATQKKVIRRQPLQAKAITAKKRDDKRRATHNEVERRRRDKINNWITKLAALVPNSGLQDTASKGGILAKACNYITELTEKQKRLEKLEVDNEKLVIEILRLNQEMAELRKENSSMRLQLNKNSIANNTSFTRSTGQRS